MQKTQKTDEFTDAVQREGCGCAKCDATTVTAEVERSKVQFLNRVDDVQVVLTMNAQREMSRKLGSEQRGAQSNKVLTEDVETLSALVKLVQEIEESARESEYCDFHEKRVLTRKTQWLSTKRRVRSSSRSRGIFISSTTRLITS